MVRAIVNIGMPASGKNIGRELAGELAIPFFSTGDVVRAVCRERGLEPDAVNSAAVSDELRAISPCELTRRVMEMALATREERVILEGMRSPVEIELLRSGLDVTVCAFVLGRGVRYRRYIGRGRQDDDPGQFDVRDRREIEYGVADAIALADRYLHNNGTLERGRELYRRIATEALGIRAGAKGQGSVLT